MNERAALPTVDGARLNQVCADLGLRLLVLFGSRATGSPSSAPESDLDLALVLAAPHPDRGHLEYQRALEDLFPGESLDLVFLHNADPLLRWEIMSDGVLLCGDPDSFYELRAFAFRDFVDSADLRALERTLSERKLARIRAQVRAAS